MHTRGNTSETALRMITFIVSQQMVHSTITTVWNDATMILNVGLLFSIKKYVTSRIMIVRIISKMVMVLFI